MYPREISHIKNSKRLKTNTQNSKKVIKLKLNKINLSNHKVYASYLY